MQFVFHRVEQKDSEHTGTGDRAPSDTGLRPALAKPNKALKDSKTELFPDHVTVK